MNAYVIKKLLGDDFSSDRAPIVLDEYANTSSAGSIIAFHKYNQLDDGQKGIICSFGKIDSGFRGSLTLLGLNSSKHEVEIVIGNTFAQIVFEKLSTPVDELYAERSGNYQNQKGITWSKE